MEIFRLWMNLSLLNQYCPEFVFVISKNGSFSFLFYFLLILNPYPPGVSLHWHLLFFSLYISNLECVNLIPQVASTPVSEVRSLKPFRTGKQVIMTEGASVLSLFNYPDHSRLCTLYLQNTRGSEWNRIDQDLNLVH